MESGDVPQQQQPPQPPQQQQPQQPQQQQPQQPQQPMQQQQQQQQQQESRLPPRSNRGKKPERLIEAAAAAIAKDPANRDEAMAGEDANLWRESEAVEFAALEDNQTWVYVQRSDVPKGSKVLSGRWVYTIKSDGRYKSRWTAKGYQQVKDRDFDEIFAPGSNASASRVFLAAAAYLDLELTHIDVSAAFLHGECKEEVYVEQPHGHERGNGMVCKLLKSLYGLRQAPRAWYEHLTAKLSKMGLEPLPTEPSIYMRRDGDSYSIMEVHVDDMFLATNNASTKASIMDMMGSAFKIKEVGGDGEYVFVGQEIQRDRSRGTIRVTQQRYIEGLQQRFLLHNFKGKPVVPLAAGTVFRKDAGKQLDALTPYRELVGCLLYLSVCTRPDISFATNCLARYMMAPRSEHWKQAKAVLCYVIGTKHLGLQFGGGTMVPVGYSDASFQGCKDTGRSTTGFVFLLNGAAVSWGSRRHKTVAMSTAEAEYMAAAETTKDALWLRNLLEDLGFPVKCCQLLGDNMATLAMIKNPVSSARAKHIDRVHHFVRERAARGEVKFDYVRSEENAADIFTKLLPGKSLEMCMISMGLS
jgi:hypothetical protein